MYNENIIYHVYNQSINYETVFPGADNYYYFLDKVREFILPHADILCYCLMPDHFHFLLKPTALGCLDSNAPRIRANHEDPNLIYYQQNLSHAIKIVLSSYTRGFNNYWGRRGSLFRQHTKSKPGYADFLDSKVGLSDEVPFTKFIPYLVNCFDYIHTNPVKANLVQITRDWPYSSAADYEGLRDSQICNYELATKLLNIPGRKNK